MHKNSTSIEVALLVVEICLKEIKKFTDQQIEEVANGNLTIKVILEPSKSNKIETTKDKNPSQKKSSLTKGKITVSDLELEDIAKTLRTLDSREEGFILLDKYTLNKEQLKKLARYIDTSPPKENTIRAFRENIIEATIGYRLRSRAIQGKTYKETFVKPQAKEIPFVDPSQNSLDINSRNTEDMI